MLSQREQKLLGALHAGKHFKANPAKVCDLLLLEPQAANPVGRRLVALGLAARVEESAQPGALFLRITDAGISEAEKLDEAARKPTIGERLKEIPFGKGIWDVVKIGIGAFLGFLATKYWGN